MPQKYFDEWILYPSVKFIECGDIQIMIIVKMKKKKILTEHGDQNVDVIEPDLCQQWKHLGDIRFKYYVIL